MPQLGWAGGRKEGKCVTECKQKEKRGSERETETDTGKQTETDRQRQRERERRRDREREGGRETEGGNSALYYSRVKILGSCLLLQSVPANLHASRLHIKQ